MADLLVFILMAIDGGFCYRSRQSIKMGNAIFVRIETKIIDANNVDVLRTLSTLFGGRRGKMCPRRSKIDFIAKCLNTFVAHCRFTLEEIVPDSRIRRVMSCKRFSLKSGYFLRLRTFEFAIEPKWRTYSYSY